MTIDQKRQIDAYRGKGYGYRQISRLTGISINSVKSYCRRSETDQHARITAAHRCENCGAALIQTPGKRAKRFCSDRCRNRWWNSHLDQVNRKANYEFTCPNCGKRFIAYGNQNRKYCSHKCYIAYRYGGKSNAGTD